MQEIGDLDMCVAAVEEMVGYLQQL